MTILEHLFFYFLILLHDADVLKLMTTRAVPTETSSIYRVDLCHVLNCMLRTTHSSRRSTRQTACSVLSLHFTAKTNIMIFSTLTFLQRTSHQLFETSQWSRALAQDFSGDVLQSHMMLIIKEPTVQIHYKGKHPVCPGYGANFNIGN